MNNLQSFQDIQPTSNKNSNHAKNETLFTPAFVSLVVGSVIYWFLVDFISEKLDIPTRPLTQYKIIPIFGIIHSTIIAILLYFISFDSRKKI